MNTSFDKEEAIKQIQSEAKALAALAISESKANSNNGKVYPIGNMFTCSTKYSSNWGCCS